MSTVTIDQRKVPKKSLDALAVYSSCSCGYSMYGHSVVDMKEQFERFGCPACHQHPTSVEVTGTR